jgi:hypothetical protein
MSRPSACIRSLERRNVPIYVRNVLFHAGVICELPFDTTIRATEHENRNGQRKAIIEAVSQPQAQPSIFWVSFVDGNCNIWHICEKESLQITVIVFNFCLKKKKKRNRTYRKHSLSFVVVITFSKNIYIHLICRMNS